MPTTNKPYINCGYCRFYPQKIFDFLCCSSHEDDEDIRDFVLKLRQEECTIPVNICFGCSFVLGLSLMVFAILNGSTSLMSITLIPYLFIIGVIITFGYPIPFSSPDVSFSDIFNDEYFRDMEDFKHFSICCFAPGPCFLSFLLFEIYDSTSVGSLFLILFSHVLVVLSILFLFTVYCTRVSEDVQERFQMKIELQED